MILQALNELYERKRDELPPIGFGMRPISFALVINGDGQLVEVEDVRMDDPGRPGQVTARSERVPMTKEGKRSGKTPPPFFLWDNTKYVAGASLEKKGKNHILEMSPERFTAFRELAHTVGDGVADKGMVAVLKFLDAWSPENAPQIRYWSEMVGANLVFKLAGERGFIHQNEAVQRAWLTHYLREDEPFKGTCLIHGGKATIARIHPPIKGVRDAQPTGANIVCFDKDAFTSYGKEQSYNAPVSEEAAFNYTTALNDLLKTGSRQRVQIGDATTVFWTERKTESEGFLGLVFSQKEDQGDLNALRLFLEAARNGQMPDQFKNERDARFYVLGLSPNAGRISVRFWHVDTVEGMWRKIGQHFADLNIVRQYANEPEFPPMWLLLKATAKREDLDNLSPLLSGALMRAILTGSAYPGGLLSAIIGRIRAEQKITYARAALIKACLVRNARLGGKPLEVSVSLDEQSTNVPYRLGRLFAVLEKVQEEGHSPAKLNSTIMDKYFGSASATPRSVFPILMKLKVHHLRKFTPQMKGLVVTRERTIAAIMDGINIADGGFPAHLNLEDQGLFALGYYHQRTDLWTSKKTAAATATATTED